MISKTLFAVLTIILVAILCFGCNSPDTTTSVSSTNGPTTSPATSELPYRTDCTLTFSSMPRLGDTVEVTFTVNVIRSDDKNQPAEGLANAKASISFWWTNTKGAYSEAYSIVSVPPEEVLVSGELPWEGSYSKGLTLHCKIKIPREGIWSIAGHFIGDGWRAGAGAEIRVAVADGTAAIMGTEDFQNGPLAYLSNNSYTGGVRGPIVANEMIPVTLGLDISKPPRPGEEVTLSCRITSVIDIQDVSIYWSFARGLADDYQQIPAAELLSDADLNWKTDVKKDEPVVFSTKFKFPTKGNWSISAAGISGTKYLTQCGHSIKISITPTISYYGWIYIIPPGTGKPPETTPGTTKAIY